MYNKKQICDELIQLFNEMEMYHPCLYFKVKKEEIFNDINNILQNNNINDENKIKYEISNIFMKIGDPHTTVDFQSQIIPIFFRKINDEIYVKKSNVESINDLYGSKLISINGISILTILNELRNLIPTNTNEWLNVQIQNKLSNIELLRILPCMKNANKFSYEFKNGIKKEFEIDNDYSKKLEAITPYNYYYVYDENNNIIYINYHRCYNQELFNNMIDEVKQISSQNNVNDFVIDIRGNEGGKSSVIMPLLEYLHGKNIVTLTDGEVFSSGSLALFELQKIGSKTIGSKIGTPINNFGEIRKIDMSKYPNLFSLFQTIRHSTKFYYFDKNNNPGCLCGKEEYDTFMSKSENSYLKYPIIFKPDIEMDYSQYDIDGNNLYNMATMELQNLHNQYKV